MPLPVFDTHHAANARQQLKHPVQRAQSLLETIGLETTRAVSENIEWLRGSMLTKRLAYQAGANSPEAGALSLRVLGMRGAELMSEESLSELIGIIYEASLQPDLWPQALQQLAADTPSVAAVISSHDMLARVSQFHQSFGLEPDYIKSHNDRWLLDNPLIDAVKRLEPGEVSGLPALIDFEAFKRHPFYLEWGKPQGFNDAINVMLERTPTRFASVALIRNDEQGFADTATIERLRILAPHLLRAVRIGRVLEHASVQENTLLQTLDALASAVFLLNAEGHLEHANASALKLAARGLTSERIDVALKKSLRSRTHAAARPSGPVSSPVERSFKVEDVEGDYFVCHVMPLGLGARKATASALTLLIVQNTTSVRSATEAVGASFGLTKRERDVLFGLVEVGGINATAALLGMSKETVKAHLKVLFHKTQTHRQSELVRLVTRWMTPFGALV